ncbi:hypothetical protein BC826DRAFT_122554 [Russula brevipes]|nr:hypothetical protein BC826DRAFT_122554 [Russula brevipes]
MLRVDRALRIGVNQMLVGCSIDIAACHDPSARDWARELCAVLCMRTSGGAAVSLRADIDALEVLMVLPEIACQRRAEAVRLESCVIQISTTRTSARYKTAFETSTYLKTGLLPRATSHSSMHQLPDHLFLTMHNLGQGLTRCELDKSGPNIFPFSYPSPIRGQLENRVSEGPPSRPNRRW